MITQTALELGFLYALVAMALFLSFRILNIADMTTDGCFVLGAAVSVTLAAGGHPILAIPAAMLAGSCAGFVTAFLQTRLGIPSILAGIVTNTGLYTVNLMAMGWKANQSLLGGSTIFTLLRDSGIGSDWYELLLAASVTILAGVLLLAFLKTRMSLRLRRGRFLEGGQRHPGRPHRPRRPRLPWHGAHPFRRHEAYHPSGVALSGVRIIRAQCAPSPLFRQDSAGFISRHAYRSNAQGCSNDRRRAGKRVFDLRAMIRG